MKITIIGSGLAGLAAALGLIEKDPSCEVTIVERQECFKPEGATFGLSPGGAKALEEISPSALQKLKRIGIFTPFNGGYMLPWWEVRDALLDEARKSERIKIRHGLSLEQIYEDAADRHIEEEKKENTPECMPQLVTTFSESSETIASDIVIGADGVHSNVRTNYLGMDPAVSTNTHVWRGHFNVLEEGKELAQLMERFPAGKYNFVRFGQYSQISFFNFDDKFPGMMLWSYTYNHGGIASPITPGETTPIDLLNEYFESLENPDESELADAQIVERVFAVSKSCEPKRSSIIATTDLEGGKYWGGRGRVTLIGDAAHAVRPVSGVGGMLAFEDAVLLSRSVAEGRRNGENNSAAEMEQCLRKFESIRLPRCRIVSHDESMRSMLNEKLGFHKVPMWDKMYFDWLQAGPDASPEPPVDPNAIYADALAGIEDLNKALS